MTRMNELHGRTATGDDVPTVLVVEDEIELLKSRLRQLARHGVRAVGSPSAEDAAAFVVSAASDVCLAIIDVNLRPDDPGDRSGIALARMFRVSGMSVPVVGYSAHFEAGAISEEDRSVFSAWIDKGRLLPDQISDRYAELAQDIFSAAHSASMGRTSEAAEAVVAFLAETSTEADERVVETRAYLRAVVGTRAYDGLERRNGYSPFDDPRREHPLELPDEVKRHLFIEEPSEGGDE